MAAALPVNVRPASTEDCPALLDAARGLGLDARDLVHRSAGSASVRLDVIGREPIRRRAGCVLVASSTPAQGARAALAIAAAAALGRAGERAVAVVRSSIDPSLLDPGAAAALGRERHAIGAAQRLLSGVADDARDGRTAMAAAAPVDVTEVMEVLALARDREDLRARLGTIVVGRRPDGAPWSAGESGVSEPMAAVLQAALEPVLAVGVGGAPLLVHCAPRSSGCASVVADLVALRCADWVLTEAAGAADLAVARYCNVKCRTSGLRPAGLLLLCTGGGARRLVRGIEAARLHGLPVVVVLDRSLPAERSDRLRRFARAAGAAAVVVAVDARGADRAAGDALFRSLASALEERSSFRYLSPRRATLADKIEAVAVRALGASGTRFVAAARADLDGAQRDGLGHLPVCPEWDDAVPVRSGRGFELLVSRVEPLVGAGFVRVIVRAVSRIGT